MVSRKEEVEQILWEAEGKAMHVLDIAKRLGEINNWLLKTVERYRGVVSSSLSVLHKKGKVDWCRKGWYVLKTDAPGPIVQIICQEEQAPPQCEARPTEPAQEPQQEIDNPRDMTVFKPFLRPVGGEDRAWGDTVWLTQLLNEERAKVGESPARHDNVLRATRAAREKLGISAALNFEEGHYADKNGQMRPLIRFSFPFPASTSSPPPAPLRKPAPRSSSAQKMVSI
jgi:hypothetical protein